MVQSKVAALHREDADDSCVGADHPMLGEGNEHGPAIAPRLPMRTDPDLAELAGWAERLRATTMTAATLRLVEDEPA